jgi:shikimate dehydrogenase
LEIQLALIGHPIKHSLSPWIHNQFLRNENIEGSYTILEVKENAFTQEVKRMKERGFLGFNVTLPYKQKIIPLLDDLDNNARNIGAVNTVLNHGGRLIGYNTDGIGYVRSLEEYYPEWMNDKERHVLLLGAGGATRAIYYALNQAGFNKIDIANRTVENGALIANQRTEETATNIFTLEEVEEHISTYDLIIQTTSVGMKPNQKQTPVRLNRLRESTIVSDIIYQPIWTNFLKEAASKGAKVHHGHTMLLHQAQYAFEIWFGKRPKINKMDIELKRLLEG